MPRRTRRRHGRNVLKTLLATKLRATSLPNRKPHSLEWGFLLRWRVRNSEILGRRFSQINADPVSLG